MQSYLDSGTAGRLSNAVCSGNLRLHAVAKLLRDRLRRAGAVVVADESAPALRHDPAVALGAHLEREPERRALEVAEADALERREALAHRLGCGRSGICIRAIALISFQNR